MNINITNYQQIVAGLKEKTKQAQQKASLAVNKELLVMYWEIGKTILHHQEKEGWGTIVIDRLAADLRSEFTDFKGLSSLNLKYMSAFAEAYPQFVQQAVAHSAVALQMLFPLHILSKDLLKAYVLNQRISNNWKSQFVILSPVQLF